MRRLVWYCCLGLTLIAAAALAVSASSGTEKAASLAKTQAKRAAALQSSLPGSAVLEAQTWREVGAKPPAVLPPSAGSVASSVSSTITVTQAAVSGTTESEQAPLMLVGEDTPVILGEGTDEHSPGEHLDVRCVLANTVNLSAWVIYGYFNPGDKVKIWFNPTTCGATPYPFKIDSVEFNIAAPGAGTLVFGADIECPNTPGDSTSGPGYSLSHPDSNWFSYTWPAAGGNYRFKLPIRPRVCVNGPFFLGIRFWTWSGAAAQRPSVVWDTAGVQAPGRQWVCNPACCDWRNVRGAGKVRAWIYGNTNDACTPVACVATTPCVVTCQTGDIIESPETPDSTWMLTDPNGGCNVTPPLFGAMNCGQTVCGKFFTYTRPSGAATRDTDWYLFTLTQADSVRLTVVSEYPVLAGVLDTNGCVGAAFVSSTTTTVGCTTIVRTSCLDPNTYAVFVASASFYCPAAPGADYRATLQCFPCGPIVCTPDTTLTTVPASWTSTTCGAADDCNLRIGEDRIVRVVIPSNGYYQFSLCGGTNWDSYIYLTDSCCGGTVIAEADEGCSTGNLSQTECLELTAGTYYLDIEPWDPTQQDPDCGPFTLNITTCAPCLPLPPNDECTSVTPVTLPATFTGDNTCATHDCSLLGAGDGETWHAFTIPDTCDVIIDYCGTNPSFIYFYTVLVRGCPCASSISRSSYDFTTCGDDNITFRFDRLPPGTYYLPVLRWDAQSTVGPYTIHVRCVPTCVLTCETGTPLEGEPNCGYGYVDSFNGGCNSSPPAFSTITCGSAVCGKSGTYQATDTTRERDTDWYRLTLAQRSYLTWNAVAEFPVTLFVLDSTHCDSILILASAGGYACDTVRAITAVLDAGEYWLFIAPSDVNYVDCGADYIAWVTCTPCDVVCLPTDVVECAETPGPGHSLNDCDGGCNNAPSPVLYQTITCGQSICGVSFTYNPTDTTFARDTDWYHFMLTDSQKVSVTVEAEFPVNVYVLNYDCANIQVFASGQAGIPCTPVTVVTAAALPPGDYSVFVAPSYSWTFDNDGWTPPGSQYRLTLGCPCVPAIKTTVYLDATNTNLVLRWIAPAAGTYKVFSTVSKTAVFDPGTWALETTVTVGSGPNSWTDPAGSVAYKRYAVQHVCQ